MAVDESIYDQVANLQTEVAALTLIVNNYNPQLPR